MDAHPVRRLDAALSLAVARKLSPRWSLVDRVVSFANGAPLWGVAGIAVVARGGDRRRAALEGAMAAGAASLLTNAVVKPLVHRPRPIRFRARRSTHTASFPSAHVATGAAFAAAVGARVPKSLLLTAPMVSVVAVSRVQSRHHRLADVTGGLGVGLLVGAAVAVAARKLMASPDTPTTTSTAEVSAPAADRADPVSDGAGGAQPGQERSRRASSMPRWKVG